MALDLWLVYAAACVGLSLTPGPSGLLALTHGVLYGLRRSAATIVGGALGFVLVVAVSMAGLGALLAASTTAFTVGKWIGAAYLVYLGVRTWLAPSPYVRLGAGQDLPEVSARKLFFQGFLCASTNPKVIIFFAAFLPQFMNPASPFLPQFMVMALTFAAIEVLYEFVVAGSAHTFAPWLSKARVGRWFNRITGTTFIGIGSALAVVNRS
ncbi:LysE family translocator [Pseudovibrio exalbescens]|uniref:Lysine transporter LysE n=1 Tax=Pseudovibrio exalbescens TaxID=197461 RepID=A0A1U7JGQ4_9HYPH|nr:LysE family transporter [Pseudovibrio exalbescens]OKL43878.1 lysine transporter LysE [Pseudovibrio exalbescens]